jgi:hypothetical protein
MMTERSWNVVVGVSTLPLVLALGSGQILGPPSAGGVEAMKDMLSQWHIVDSIGFGYFRLAV